jgi:hypothetical protein
MKRPNFGPTHGLDSLSVLFTWKVDPSHAWDQSGCSIWQSAEELLIDVPRENSELEIIIEKINLQSNGLIMNRRTSHLEESQLNCNYIYC